MKKLCILLLVLLLVCIAAHSQVRRVRIVNTSSCNVLVTLRYTTPSGSPICTMAGTSSRFTVVAGYTQTYSGLAGPGTPEYVFGMPGPYNRYIVGANILSSDPTCPVSSVTVGETTCGYPPLNNITVRINQTCVVCGTVNAQWITDIPGLEATLLLF